MGELGTAVCPCPCPCLSSLCSCLDSLVASGSLGSETDSFEVIEKFLGHRPMHADARVDLLTTGYMLVVLVLDETDVEHGDMRHLGPPPNVCHIDHNKLLPPCSIFGKCGISMEPGAHSTAP